MLVFGAYVSRFGVLGFQVVGLDELLGLRV